MLMVEPFGAVDDYTRLALQETLIDLWQESQITGLFVTHSIDEAVALGDRVVVLSDRPGKIVEEFEIELARPRRGLGQEFTKLCLEVRQSFGAIRSADNKQKSSNDNCGEKNRY